jgi:putative ABC transport system ATP-binding protein
LKGETVGKVLERLEGVWKEYPMVKALCDVTMDIRDGELLLIVGPSGSGKSTLMHIAGVLDSPTRGKVLLGGKKVPEDDAARARLRSEYIGFVFQDFGLIKTLNARDNILLPAVFGGSGTPEKVQELADMLGITERLDHFPGQLSGGERQRVAIARSLVNDPEIVFADEPTGNLDSKSGEKVMEFLRSLADSGKSIVVVSHNPEHEAYADRIVHLKDGRIIKGGS